MTATNHGLFGAVIAISLQKYPAIALALAPLSHFLLDAIPHYGGLVGNEIRTRKFFTFLILDALLAVLTTLLVAWAWQDIALLIVVCAFLAASPDLMWVYYQYSGIKYMNIHLLPKFHSFVQWSEHKTGIFVYTDLIWFIIFFPLLMYFGIST
jgi:hypothetical protein